MSIDMKNNEANISVCKKRKPDCPDEKYKRVKHDDSKKDLAKVQQERLARFQALMADKAVKISLEQRKAREKQQREQEKVPVKTEEGTDCLDEFMQIVVDEATTILAKDREKQEKRKRQRHSRAMKEIESRIVGAGSEIFTKPCEKEEAGFHQDFVRLMKNVESEKRKEDMKMKEILQDVSDEEPALDIENELDDEKHEKEEEMETYFEMATKYTAKRDLPQVDHSKINYLEIEKNLYVQVREITNMKDHEVQELRDRGKIKCRGKNVPRPIQNFYQCGLPTRVINIIERRDFSQPFAIQQQVIPVLMMGRDCIGIAETGSGKTLAYVLPLLRHVLAQPPLSPEDGPIGLVMSPTRELAIQINKEVNKFTKVLHLVSTCVYGGAPISHQLRALKSGTHICVFTPGRFIDILMTSGGKITNLSRCSFCVLDEADRLFDLGFEPQINMVLRNIQPKAQICMFSATFPPHIEALARNFLKKPIEVTAGMRNCAAKNINQYVDVLLDEEAKFRRLLHIFGEWQDHACAIVVFFATQRDVDEMYSKLLRYGYQCLTLHAGQDQEDRHNTLVDFKTGVSNYLLATSIAARGLDISRIQVVCNYSSPDNLNEYIHRIGRCGRGGQPGFAYTFLTSADGHKASTLIEILEECEHEIQRELIQLRDEYLISVGEGILKKRKNFKSSGYKTGRGYTFDKSTEKTHAMRLRDEIVSTTKTSLGMNPKFEPLELPEEPETSAEPFRGQLQKWKDDEVKQEKQAEIKKKLKTKTVETNVSLQMKGKTEFDMSEPVFTITPLRGAPAPPCTPMPLSTVTSKISEREKHLNGTQKRVDESIRVAHEVARTNGQTGPHQRATGDYVDDLEINSYPEFARMRISQRGSLDAIEEICPGVKIQLKGQYVAPGQQPILATRRLYISCVGDSPHVVTAAKHECYRFMEDVAKSTLRVPSKKDHHNLSCF